MKDTEILEEYHLIKGLTHPLFLVIFLVIILFSISLVLVRNNKSYIIITSLLFLAFLLGYIDEVKYRILLFSDRLVIKRALSRDKTFLISDLVYIRKTITWWSRVFSVNLEFYLKNGERFIVSWIKDYYDLIENIKKINPNVKIEIEKLV